MAVPVPTIICGTEILPREIAVISIEVRRQLNRVPEASLVLGAGRTALDRFATSNLPYFEPGRPIRIELRYEGDPADTPVFEGLVVRHAVEADAEGATVRLELKDTCYKLTRTRRSIVFQEANDGDLIRKIVEAAGLTVGEVADTKLKRREIVQYNATDWDFLCSRAEVLGMVVDAHLGMVAVVPTALGAPRTVLDVGLGDVLELGLQADGGSQWAGIQAVGWDPQTLSATSPEAATPPNLTVGNLDAGAIAAALGGDSYTLLHPALHAPGELKSWADARLLQSRFAMLQGRLLIPGDATLAPRDTIEIQGVGERFSGVALVSGVVQRLGARGWTTELRLGLSPEWFARRPDLSEVPAGGMVPPVGGLRLATVSAFEEDPTREFRLKVLLPGVDSSQGALWARVAAPDAGPGRGICFRPEVGDEVVLGFLDDDPRQAIVVGSLHGSKNRPPPPVDVPDAENARRAIVTRAGTRIVFDDAVPSLSIETTSGGSADGEYQNRIVMDEKAGAISIEDRHGNKVLLDKEGIRITSANDLTLEATGKVVLKGATLDIQ